MHMNEKKKRKEKKWQVDFVKKSYKMKKKIILRFLGMDNYQMVSGGFTLECHDLVGATQCLLRCAPLALLAEARQ